MATHIKEPVLITASGNKPKIIKEYVGRVCTKTSGISLAVMESPEGWIEEGQTPGFDEYTYVVNGVLRVETREQVFDIKTGEAVWVHKDEWVRYSTPYNGGATYVAVCLPAFSPDIVHRDK